MRENLGQDAGVSGSGGETNPDVAKIEAYVKADIDKINETLPTYKQMLRVVVTDQEMIKTTTGKVKRYEETKKM